MDGSRPRTQRSNAGIAITYGGKQSGERRIALPFLQ